MKKIFNVVLVVMVVLLSQQVAQVAAEIIIPEQPINKGDIGRMENSINDIARMIRENKVKTDTSAAKIDTISENFDKFSKDLAALSADSKSNREVLNKLVADNGPLAQTVVALKSIQTQINGYAEAVKSNMSFVVFVVLVCAVLIAALIFVQGRRVNRAVTAITQATERVADVITATDLNNEMTGVNSRLDNIEAKLPNP